MSLTATLHSPVIRSLRAPTLAFCAALVFLAAPAAAHALPGDPPIVPLGPANGSTVPADELGIHLTFQCPAYHSEEPLGDIEEEVGKKEEGEEKEAARVDVEKEDEEGPEDKPKEEDLAGSDSYIVRFSTGPATGAEGLLTTAGFGEEYGEGFADPDSGKTSCGAYFEPPPGGGPPSLYHGTVYWQVAREVTRVDREAISDPGKEADLDKTEYEVGPVWSFSVEPKVEQPSLLTREHIYAGYLTEVEFSSFSDLGGATVELQRFTEGTWTGLAQEPGRAAGPTDFFPKLPASHTALRAVLKTPSLTLPLEPQKVTVRKFGRRRAASPLDDGLYRNPPESESTPDDESMQGAPPPLHLQVVGGGTRVIDLQTSIEVGCPGPDVFSPDSKVMVKTELRSARIAPDGTVVGRLLAKGSEPEYVTFDGQFFDRRLSGTLTTAFGSCSGTQDIEAVKVARSDPKSSARAEG